ncbi:MAG: efflux RND transporter permease subunit [Desulfovibrio sp.]|jgi:multidrug efflux pump|nr:efflux RND transporter permease subunit [Desulfovibrio sp.]
MPRFFIDRPIFACVIALIIMIAGALSLYSLPRAQFPNIAPPEISISAIYLGASAKTVEDTVTQIIEQQMTGVDNLIYMNSTSDSSGRSVITLTFAPGTNPDIAQVQAQNKLQLATPLLPDAVQRQGIRVAKSTRNFLIVLNLISEDGSMEQGDLTDYLASNLQDPISRLPGVGDIQLFGTQYALRIWLDPVRMREYRLNPSDIAAAIQSQNAQGTGGQIGAGPALEGQQINISVTSSSRLESVEQFENILLRVNPDGSSLYLKDVARAELGGEQYFAYGRYNGHPSAGLGIKLASGANALETADLIKQTVASLSAFFPPGLKAVYPFDSTLFVRLSIEEVFKTLGIAIVLVFLVMYLFLQNFRATLIPTITVPVVLLGTFGVFAAAGFSINTLTMFGIVLVIGLLVDDAIVVVENVERVMREENLAPKEAARVSMDQISSALVGVGTVLSAVFLPMAFFGGSTGVIYRQFSITLASAMILSVFVALSLTPALCATLLQPHRQAAQQGLFGRFNRWFDGLSLRYQRRVFGLISAPARYLAVFLLAVVLMVLLFLRLPTAFLPIEDQGLLLFSVQLDPGASFERTDEVLHKLERYLLEEEAEAVEATMMVTGYGFSGIGQNAALGFIRLRDWSLRTEDRLRVQAVAARANQRFSSTPQARVFVFAPPAVMELGTANGFDFQLIDRGSKGHEELMLARNTLLAEAARRSETLVNVRPNGLDDVEQFRLQIDLVNAGAMGLTQEAVNAAVAAYWGGQYVNDFMDKGRTKKVYIQADAPYRMQAADFFRHYAIRNAQGEMVDFSAFLSGSSTFGSPRLERFNGVPSSQILGEAAPGKSSGQAMDLMEELTRTKLPGFDFAWTGLSLQEKLSGAQAPLLYALSLTIVFLCLAALYESWSIPISVLLVVPVGVIGALLGAYLRGFNNDIYFQVGLLTTMGLSAKNAILIVEFAKNLHEEGLSAVEAVLRAVRIRLRPIIMTSLAFILGVLPLVVSTGAGSAGQNAIGTAVMAGMICAAFFGIYFTPIFFILVNRLFQGRAAPEDGGSHA